MICAKLKSLVTEWDGMAPPRMLLGGAMCSHENEDLDGFMTYIHRAKKHMEAFVTQVEKHIKEKKGKVEDFLRSFPGRPITR